MGCYCVRGRVFPKLKLEERRKKKEERSSSKHCEGKQLMNKQVKPAY
jgi:hypothetical protein